MTKTYESWIYFPGSIPKIKQKNIWIIGLLIWTLLPILYYIYATKITSNTAMKNSIIIVSKYTTSHFSGIHSFASKGQTLYDNSIFIGYINAVFIISSIIVFIIYFLFYYRIYSKGRFSSKKSISNISFNVLLSCLFFFLCSYMFYFNIIEEKHISFIRKYHFTYLGSYILSLSVNIMTLTSFMTLILYFFALKNHIKSPSNHKYTPKSNNHHDNCQCSECQSLSNEQNKK